MIYSAVREKNSFNYQLPQFLALWPELKAAVWIMSPEHLSWLSWAREDNRDLSVLTCESDAPDLKLWGQIQALASCPSGIPKDTGPQTGASQGCLPWEASSELSEPRSPPRSLVTLG